MKSYLQANEMFCFSFHHSRSRSDPDTQSRVSPFCRQPSCTQTQLRPPSGWGHRIAPWPPKSTPSPRSAGTRQPNFPESPGNTHHYTPRLLVFHLCHIPQTELLSHAHAPGRESDRSGILLGDWNTGQVPILPFISKTYSVTSTLGHCRSHLDLLHDRRQPRQDHSAKMLYFPIFITII